VRPMAEDPPPQAPGEAPTAVARGQQPAKDWQVLWREGALNELLRHRDQWEPVADPRLDQALVMAAVFTHNLELARQLAQKLPQDSPYREYLAILQQNDLQALVDFMVDTQPDESESFEASLHHNALAYALARGGARTRAVQILSQTLERYPDYRVTMANVVWVYRIARMPEQETRVLQRWVLDVPENMDARTMLFERRRRSGDYADARQAAEVAYSLFPDNVRANLNLAQAYLDAGEYGVALTTVNNAILANPRDQRLLVARAEVLLHAGQAQAALDELGEIDLRGAEPELAQRAQRVELFGLAENGRWEEVAARPSIAKERTEPSLATRMLVASALIRQDQMAAAADLMNPSETAKGNLHPLEEVVLAVLGREVQPVTGEELIEPLQRDPELAAEFLYGLALKFAGYHEASLAVFESVNEQTPQSSLMVDLMLRALLDGITIEGRFEKAKAVAEQNASMPVAWLILAMLANRLGEDDAELAALDRAAQAGPDDAMVWMHRGQYFSRKNMVPEAMDAFRKQLAINPNDAAANNNLAYYLSLTGENLEEALDRAEKAKDLMAPETNPNVLHTLGVAQLRTGNLDESEKNLAVALEMRPGEPTLLLDYGELLIKKDRQEQGLGYVELALRYAELLGLDFPRRNEAIQILTRLKPAPAS
jgi:tetratricopeptide (TPR) repeat protein